MQKLDHEPTIKLLDKSDNLIKFVPHDDLRIQFLFDEEINMTREEFLATFANYQKLNSGNTFVTVHDPKDVNVKAKNFYVSSIIDWGIFSNTKEAYFLAREFMAKYKKNYPIILDNSGNKKKSIIETLYNSSKKKFESNTKATSPIGKGMFAHAGENTVWAKNTNYEPYSKGLVLLGDAYSYFAKDFFECFNNPNRDNVIETLLRIYGPSPSHNRDITAYSSWYIHTFELTNQGRFTKNRLSFTDELFKLYETTDENRMRTLNHWKVG